MPTPAVPGPDPSPPSVTAGPCVGAIEAAALPPAPTLFGFFCLRTSGWEGASTTTGGSGVASSAVTSPPDVIAAASCAMAGADMTRLMAAPHSATYANLDTETPQYAVQLARYIQSDTARNKVHICDLDRRLGVALIYSRLR